VASGLYVARFEETIYVLHAFMKKTQQTRAADLNLAKERLRQIRSVRRESKED
jgi:phage-related protein